MWRRWHRYRRYPRCALCVAAPLGMLGALLLPAGVLAGGTPSGFYYGADGNGPTGVGTGYPYSEPDTGGIYGGYVGEVGTWTNWQGCTTGRALNDTAINEANADEPWPGWGIPIPGVAFYWFTAGPGADPNYNGAGIQLGGCSSRAGPMGLQQYSRRLRHGFNMAVHVYGYRTTEWQWL